MKERCVVLYAYMYAGLVNTYYVHMCESSILMVDMMYIALS